MRSRGSPDSGEGPSTLLPLYAVAEQAAKADHWSTRRSRPGTIGRLLVTHAKMRWLELLNLKADLERELGNLSLNCSKCGLDVHWVSGLGITSGHWADREGRAARGAGGLAGGSQSIHDLL
jgi:hypothetical protein